MYKITIVLEDTTRFEESSARRAIDHWLEDARRWLTHRGFRIDSMKVEPE